MNTVTRPANNFPHARHFYIDGQWTQPASDRYFELVDSATEEQYSRFAEAQALDVERAVAAARRAFDEGPWPRLTHAERAKVLQAIGRELSLRVEDSAIAWSRESGITFGLAKALCRQTPGLYERYAGLASTFPFVERHQPSAGAGKFAYLVREPVGVVAAIVPWNGPELIIPHKVALALLAGCTVIVKASPEAPAACHIFAEVCDKVGLPAGVVNVLTADREVSELLVRNPGVDKVTFTGSTAAGRRIASLCGERIARCTLELGGKSAAVILDDYDVAVAAKTISRAAGMLTGQVCASLTRIIVSRDRHDALVDAFCATYGQLKVGDPFDAATEMGPLSTSRQRERVEGYIAKGLLEGATLAIGGKRPAYLDRGFFVEPTVFGCVNNHSTIAREEIFGPVLCVIPAASEADAVAMANDSIYGLNASVFTNDVERAWATARQLRSGNVGHNALRVDQALAFGGMKQSGVGREGGAEGLLSFLEAKTVLMDGEPSF